MTEDEKAEAFKKNFNAYCLKIDPEDGGDIHFRYGALQRFVIEIASSGDSKKYYLQLIKAMLKPFYLP